MPTRSREREHLAEDCTDDTCPRYPCVIWRKAFAAGYRKGYDEGFAEGYAKGFADGYAKGFAERPLRTVFVQVPAGK
jgi:hypothetical protein